MSVTRPPHGDDPDIRVVFVHRRRGIGHFSLERLFEWIREALPRDIHSEIWHCPYTSEGVVDRIGNVVAAAAHQGDVTHVTGDVHYVALLLRRERTVITMHDAVMLRRLSGWRAWILALLWYRIPARRARVILSPSQFARTEVVAAARCDPAAVVVIHNPVDPRLRALPKPFDDACPRILQIGAAWNKNLERQAEALAGIRCHLDFVGALSPAHRATLERYGIAYTATSSISDADLRQRYAACDLLLFASTYEGFGMPIVEANVVGRPVITSNVASMPEVAGGAACLVDPFDVASIRAGVLRVIQDEPYRTELVARGFRNARRFDPTHIGEQYARLYRAVASGQDLPRFAPEALP